MRDPRKGYSVYEKIRVTSLTITRRANTGSRIHLTHRTVPQGLLSGRLGRTRRARPKWTERLIPFSSSRDKESTATMASASRRSAHLSPMELHKWDSRGSIGRVVTRDRSDARSDISSPSNRPQRKPTRPEQEAMQQKVQRRQPPELLTQPIAPHRTGGNQLPQPWLSSSEGPPQQPIRKT